MENVTINKQVTLHGAGSGTNPLVDTIIQSAVANTPVIQITGSGANATDRLIVSDLRVTGATGGANPGAGVLVVGTGAVGYMTFSNVATVANQVAGLAFNNTFGVTDIQVANSTLSNNGNDGIRIATAIPSFVGGRGRQLPDRRSGWPCD